MKISKKLYYTRLLIIIALVSMIISIPTIVKADTYGYSFTIAISDNTGSNRSYLPILTGINTQGLISAGYINSSGNNTALKESGVSTPYGHSNNNSAIFVQSLLGFQTRSYTEYLQNIPAQSQSIIVGNNGYFTTNDTATIELSDNFTISVTGFLVTDNGTSENITTKTGALSLSIEPTTSGKVNAIVTGTSGLSQTLYPNGAGVFTGIPTLVGAATHWESQLTNDGDTSYVEQGPVAATNVDLYEVENGTIPSYAIIDSVVVHTVTVRSGSPVAQYPVIYLAGANVTGVGNASYAAYTDYGESLSRPGGGSWTYADIPNIQIGVQLASTGVLTVRSTQVYVVVNYHYADTSVSVSNITTGLKNVNLSADGTNLVLNVGGTSNTTTLYNAVVDTANNYIWNQNNVMPYITSVNITVDGNPKVNYQPLSMISGTRLVDNLGIKDADITWGTNPTGITITVGGISSSGAVVPTGTSVSPIATTVNEYTQPAGWYGGSTNLANLPFYTTFLSAAASFAGGMPVNTLYIMMMLGLVTAVGLGVGIFTGSVLIAAITGGMLIWMEAGIKGVDGLSVLPVWMVFTYFVFALGIAYLARQH